MICTRFHTAAVPWPVSLPRPPPHTHSPTVSPVGEPELAVCTHVLRRPITVYSQACVGGRGGGGGGGGGGGTCSGSVRLFRLPAHLLTPHTLSPHHPCTCVQQSPREGGGLALVSQYGGDEYPSRLDIPLLFHGAGHYDLLLRARGAAEEEEEQGLPPRARL